MLPKVGLRTDADALYSEDFWEDDDQIKSNSIYWTPSSSRRSSPANHLALSVNSNRSSRLLVSPGSLSRSSTSEDFLSQLPLDEGSLSACHPAAARAYPKSFRPNSFSRPSTAHHFPTIPLRRNRENLSTTMTQHEDNSSVVAKSLKDAIRNYGYSRDNAQEIAILEFIASTKESCPFVQGVRIQKGFSDDVFSHIHLVN
ncbi:hypothetical protein GALMADRAFT_437455 [Galerina marginata CBS 339.88]|uniref:Uncharacterized protein n=1 Tax=Galerina marginata (strain CBS 339.88) TaxID=685588 RepID=A0A067TBG6_GALM3|nr:hypothetical protein GALMADRAFT_437455 [Galerina marginata CBS 339.88]